MTPPLTLKEFLVAPVETVQAVAPQTIIYGPAGTRRAAVLAGSSALGNEYAIWVFEQLLGFYDLFFRHGVRNLFSSVLISKNIDEKTPDYREHLWRWSLFVSNDEAMAYYQQKGWRVRILYHEHLPELQEAVERLQVTESSQARYTLWYSFTPDPFFPTRWMLDMLKGATPQTADEAIKLLYGEAIPPASIFISYGKTLLLPEVVPPMLHGHLDCYWLQRPYYVDEYQLRSIIYDHAYQRKTWLEDKTGRAEQVLKYREAWENNLVMGVGTRLGPFWYPAPISVPFLPDGET